MADADVPAVARLFLKVFRNVDKEASPDLEEYLRALTLGSPCYSAPAGTHVYQQQDGRIRSALLTDGLFSGASFANAQLARADLSRGDFSGCDFSNADLRSADLEDADFTGANLSGARLKVVNGKRSPGVMFDPGVWDD